MAKPCFKVLIVGTNFSLFRNLPFTPFMMCCWIFLIKKLTACDHREGERECAKLAMRKTTQWIRGQETDLSFFLLVSKWQSES